MAVKMVEPSKRLFVGNLFPEISHHDLQKLFEKFGKIDNIEIKTKKDIDGKVVSTFAFVDLNVNDGELANCISTFTNTKWKGHVLRLQQAKESFMDRLAKERKEKEAKSKSTSPQDLKYDPLQMLKKSVKFDVTSSNLEEIPKEKKKREKDKKKSVYLGADVPEVAIESKYAYTPFTMLKTRNLQDSGAEHCKDVVEKKNVDEGTVNNGLVSFNDEKEVSPAKVIKQTRYNSDSEVEEEKVINGKVEKKKVFLTKEEKVEKKIVNKVKKKKAMDRVDRREHRLTESTKSIRGIMPGSVPRKRYYSSSSEEEAEPTVVQERKTGDDVMKTFQSFSNFWKDEDDEVNEINNAEENVDILNSFKLKIKQKPLYSQKLESQDKNKKIKFDECEENENKIKKTSTKLCNDDSGQTSVPKAKALSLQSKAIGDDRFKMDERFCDKRDDIEDDHDLENQVDLPNDVSERNRNLDILSSLFDKDLTKEEKVKRKPSIFKDSSRLRFDPDQEDHKKLIRKAAENGIFESEEKDYGEVEEDKIKKEDNVAHEPSTKRYFEVSENLKQSFTSKNTSKSCGFSFGFAQNIYEDKKRETSSLLSANGKQKIKNPQTNGTSNQFKCDSDDEGMMEETEIHSKVVEASRFGLQLKGKGNPGLQESFFFKEGDARLEDGLNFFFKQKVDFDALRVAYNAQRPQLSAILKKKMRQKAKRNEKLRFGRGKKKENSYKGGKKTYKNKK